MWYNGLEVYLPALERAEAVVIPSLTVPVRIDAVPVYHTGAVKGIPGRPPRADAGDPHAVPVGLQLHALLDVFCPPHMEAFLILPVLFAGKVQVLEHDAVHVIKDCDLDQRQGHVDRELLVCVPNQPVDVFAFLPGLLVLPLPVDQTVQSAFVTREVDDTFRVDCTVGSHDAPGSRGIDAQVYREDPVRERVVCRHQGF